MLEMFSLKGRVALVTGASRGLGFAMAEALAGAGATVVIDARDAAAVEAAATLLRERGARSPEAMAFDVSDSKAATAGLAAVPERYGRLDILINNAGIQHRVPVTEWTDDDFERVVAVNLTSCFRLAREAVRHMLPRKWGRIINTGSVAAILGRPTIHGYVAAKAGLHGLTRSLAAELGREGIRDQCFGAWVFCPPSSIRRCCRTPSLRPGSSGARPRAVGPSPRSWAGPPCSSPRTLQPTSTVTSWPSMAV